MPMMHDDWGACVLPDGSLRLVPVGVEARARRRRRLRRLSLALDLVGLGILVAAGAALGGPELAAAVGAALVAARWTWRTR